MKNKWTELTVLLNGIENGAKKDQKQWKSFLYKWKSKTKKKARALRENISKSGGGGYSCTELPENRLMSIFGWVHVIGCPGAPDEVDPDEVNNNNGLGDNNNTQDRNNEVDNNTRTQDAEGIFELQVGPENYLMPAEPKEMDSLTPKTTGAVRKEHKKRKNFSQATQLETAAQSYSQSNEEMAVAIKEMALAVKEMAVAGNEMAKAISQLAESFSKIADAMVKAD